jgi:serine/threonine protein phosphatase PrpC
MQPYSSSTCISLAALAPLRLHRLPALLAYGITDIGPVRRANEDNLLLDEDLGLAAVADGMGGHAAGDVASTGVLTELRAFVAERAVALMAADAEVTARADGDITQPDPAASAVCLLQAAIQHANTALYTRNRAELQADGGGMGSTVTGFWHPRGSARLVLFHVGDSRLYCLRDGVLHQLTRDQTIYQQALDAGMTSNLPARNVLLQAVGPTPSIVPEVRAHLVMPGDLLMLCSDGLHGSVPHAEIERILVHADADTLDDACAQLIQLAYRHGGRDNITVLLAAALAS